jgi:hypothetical protein
MKKQITENRKDYESPHGLASWWVKDGYWHIAIPSGCGDNQFLWTAEEFYTREEAIAAIEPDPDDEGL